MPQKVKHKVWVMGVSRDCFWHLTTISNRLSSPFPRNVQILIFIVIFAYTVIRKSKLVTIPFFILEIFSHSTYVYDVVAAFLSVLGGGESSP